MNEAMFKSKLISCKELLLLQNTAMTNILEKRLVFNRLDKIIKANPDLHVYNLFWDWYFYNYIDSQVMELMRILDQDESSKNLIRFIDSLISGYNLDNTFFERIKLSLATGTVPKELLPSVVPLFDIDELKKDRADLVNEVNVASVRNYRDWKVAHNDAQKWKNLDLNLTKLNECIDFLHKRILAYELRLNGSGYPDTGLLPHIAYDWESIFRVPWIK